MKMIVIGFLVVAMSSVALADVPTLQPLHGRQSVDLNAQVAPVQQRKSLLNQVGLTEQTSRMDDMDLDVLFLRAKNYPLSKLQSTYPNLNPEALGELQQHLVGG